MKGRGRVCRSTCLGERCARWRSLAVALALLLSAAAVTPADELVVERKYRVTAREVNLDLEQRTLRAEGDAILTYQDIELRADTITADLESQSASASGNVRLSHDGDVLFASAVEYDLDDRSGVLTDARGHVRDIYFSGRSLRLTPQQMVLTGGTFTTCDAPRPHYHVSAQQIVLRPEDRIISRKAALWYHGRRLLNLPNWSHSLRPAEAASPLVPIAGFSRRDGAFAGIRYRFPFAGAASAQLETRYTTARGIRALARAETRHSWGAVAASVSRRDDLTQSDLGLFAPEVPLSDITLDRLPEATVTLDPVPLSRWADVRLRAAGGQYREEPSGVHGARGVVDLYLEGRPVSVGDISMRPLAGVRGVRYDGGQHRSATGYGVALDWQPGADLALHLSYLQRKAHGAGPFTFDAFDLSRELTLGLAARLGENWRAEIIARRDLERGSFPAFDVELTRVDHCLEYGLRWRKVGGEFGFRVGLTQQGPVQAPGAGAYGN